MNEQKNEETPEKPPSESKAKPSKTKTKPPAAAKASSVVAVTASGVVACPDRKEGDPVVVYNSKPRLYVASVTQKLPDTASGAARFQTDRILIGPGLSVLGSDHVRFFADRSPGMTNRIADGELEIYSLDEWRRIKGSNLQGMIGESGDLEALRDLIAIEAEIEDGGTIRKAGRTSVVELLSAGIEEMEEAGSDNARDNRARQAQRTLNRRRRYR